MWEYCFRTKDRDLGMRVEEWKKDRRDRGEGRVRGKRERWGNDSMRIGRGRMLGMQKPHTLDG